MTPRRAPGKDPPGGVADCRLIQGPFAHALEFIIGRSGLAPGIRIADRLVRVGQWSFLHVKTMLIARPRSGSAEAVMMMTRGRMLVPVLGLLTVAGGCGSP